MTQDLRTYRDGARRETRPRAVAALKRRASRRADRGAVLDVERLAQAALQAVHGGDGDAAPLQFLSPLEHLVEALAREARLTPAGTRATADSLVASLVTQVRLQRATFERPEIARIAIEEPLVVVGLPRTGTSLLQNLLAQHPGLRSPLLWELLHPATLVRTAAERRRLIAATEAYVREYYLAAPEFRAIHFLAPELPEECHRLLGTTFTNEIFGIRYRVPTYMRWLRAQDARRVYRHHRALLRCILSRGEGGRVVLKCPTHLWHLDALLATYPDAHIVRLHRDPTETIASASSLTAVVRSARSDAVDKHEIGREWLDAATRGLARGRRVLRTARASVLDLRYRDLVRDPLGTVAAVCDFAGVPFGRVADRRVRRFLAVDPHARSGGHAYSPEEFGIDPARTAERFADYRAEHLL